MQRCMQFAKQVQSKSMWDKYMLFVAGGAGIGATLGAATSIARPRTTRMSSKTLGGIGWFFIDAVVEETVDLSGKISTGHTSGCSHKRAGTSHIPHCGWALHCPAGGIVFAIDKQVIPLPSVATNMMHAVYVIVLKTIGRCHHDAVFFTLLQAKLGSQSNCLPKSNEPNHNEPNHKASKPNQGDGCAQTPKTRA